MVRLAASTQQYKAQTGSLESISSPATGPSVTSLPASMHFYRPDSIASTQAAQQNAQQHPAVTQLQLVLWKRNLVL